MPPTRTGRDEQFATFIKAHRKTGLIYGTIGDGWHFPFAPEDSSGFLVCARDGMKGKGFLRPESVGALTELAVEKHLFTRPPDAE